MKEDLERLIEELAAGESERRWYSIRTGKPYEASFYLPILEAQKKRSLPPPPYYLPDELVEQSQRANKMRLEISKRLRSRHDEDPK